MELAYQITTQNVEEYGENFYKYKGGSVYYVKLRSLKKSLRRMHMVKVYTIITIVLH